MSVEPQLSSASLRKFARAWSEYAKEPIRVEQVCGTLYGYGSELACLRIYYRYRHSGCTDHSVGYSENLNTWFIERDVTELSATMAKLERRE